VSEEFESDDELSVECDGAKLSTVEVVGTGFCILVDTIRCSSSKRTCRDTMILFNVGIQSRYPPRCDAYPTKTPRCAVGPNLNRRGEVVFTTYAIHPKILWCRYDGKRPFHRIIGFVFWGSALHGATLWT